MSFNCIFFFCCFIQFYFSVYIKEIAFEIRFSISSDWFDDSGSIREKWRKRNLYITQNKKIDFLYTNFHEKFYENRFIYKSQFITYLSMIFAISDFIKIYTIWQNNKHYFPICVVQLYIKQKNFWFEEKFQNLCTHIRVRYN